MTRGSAPGAPSRLPRSAPSGAALPMALLALAVIGCLLAAVSAIALHEARLGRLHADRESALAEAESAVLDALAGWDAPAAIARAPGASWTIGRASAVPLDAGTWWVVGTGRVGGALRRVGAFVRLDRPPLPPAALLAAAAVEADPGASIAVAGTGCPADPALPPAPSLLVRVEGDAAGAAGALDPDAVVVDASDSVWNGAARLAAALSARAAAPAGGGGPADGTVVHATGPLTIPSGARWRGAVVADGPLVVERWAVVSGIVVARSGVVLEEGARIEGRLVVLGGTTRIGRDAAVAGSDCPAGEGALLGARAVVAPGRGWVDVW